MPQHSPGKYLRFEWHLPIELTCRHIKFHDIYKGRIGVLLGTSCVQFTHALEWIRGSPTRPAELRTELRWTIAGEFMHRRRTKSSFRKNFVLFATTEIHRNAADQFPPDILEHYWSIEKTANEPAESFVLSDVDNEALQTLEKTCRHNGERYEIGLPWKSDVNLPNNYYAALNRVRFLEKSLTRNNELKKKFDETLNTDLQKQYVTTVVMQNSPPEKIWYLPTHPVENPNKPGKVRRVANAASKYKNESLNSNLLAGPDLLANLLELILRFREHAVGVLADIEGMFMQIAIRPEDLSALRFLWMSDNYVLQYQYIRLTFGANCSPFCAILVLRRCAQDLASQFPDVLQAVLNNFYMDDFIQSFSTPVAARQLTNDLRTVLQRGGFRLTKFISNNSDALSSIPAEDREKSASKTKVLGQTWCLRTDSYTAPPPNSVDNPTTLRQLLSLVSSIFDPIGLLSPLVIQFKIMLQSLWKLGQTWDQAIPDYIQTSVNKLTDCYRAMPTVSVPRRAFRSATTVELHVFTEASNSALAAVIYARQPTFSHTSAQQTFVIGKSRVSPIKQKSIPKLELEAAVLGARLL